MNLKALETLAAIEKRGSFAKTAEALNMTLSTVSMQMRGLEESLGVALFDRTFRPPKLTPVGRRVAQQARVVSKACDDLLATCRKPEDFAGDYRIGFVLTSSIRHLPGLLARAQSEVPEVHFDVESGLSDDLLARVMTGDLDAAVITGGELPAQVASVTLTTEELVYGLPTNAANWSIKTCMARLSFIHFMPETGIGRLIARHLKEASLVPHDVIVLDSVEAVRECVSKGVGFSILPRPDIERHAGRAISIKPLAGERIERELVLVYLRGGALEPHIPVLRRLFDT